MRLQRAFVIVVDGSVVLLWSRARIEFWLSNILAGFDTDGLSACLSSDG